MNLDSDVMKFREACGRKHTMALMCLPRDEGRPASSPANLASPERKYLLDLARATLRQVATHHDWFGPQLNAADVSPMLARTTACFVTLTENGALRGCVGHIVPQEPLYRAVVDKAQNAALRDGRFPPVRSDEVDRIKIEISVLTDPQPLPFNSPEELLGKLHPHADGVVLRIGPCSATFLPRVWELYPDKVEFLNRLAEKAGCPPSAWRGRDTSISVYHVETFEEPG